MSNAKVPMSAEQQSSAPAEFVKYIFMTYAAALLLMAFFYFSTFGLGLATEHGRWGEFGDFVGGVLNPLTSFFTLLVALLVWSLQKKELAATNAALADQLRLSRITVADSVLDAYIEAIRHHAAAFNHTQGLGEKMLAYYGDAAFEKATLVVKEKLGSVNLSTLQVDINHPDSPRFYTRYVEQLTPIVESLAVTFKYLNDTYSSDLKESRLDRIRISLSTQQLLAVIYFVFLTQRKDTRELMIEVQLLKYFTNCPQKSWFETKA